MDDISAYEEETASTKLVRNTFLIIVFLFVIVVSCIALVHGFTEENKEGIALMGIGLACFAITTFVLVRRIFKQDIDEAAKIPTYMQLIILVFLGIAILIADSVKTTTTVHKDCSPSCSNCAFVINDSYVCGSYSNSNGTRTCTYSSMKNSAANTQLNSMPISQLESNININENENIEDPKLMYQELNELDIFENNENLNQLDTE